MKEQIMTTLDHLLSTLDHSKSYTLAVATEMPASKFNFKPVEAVWSFGELLNHVAYGIYWWQENQVKGNPVDWDPPVVKNAKADVLANLNKAYDSFEDTLNNIEMSDRVIEGFHATIDHITHHRGQAILHLRLNGITPPEYSY